MKAKCPWILGVGALALAACHDHGSAHAAADHGAVQGHDHAHEHANGAAAKLTLNKGQKWQTDATLRAGFSAIRNEMQAALEPIHADKYSPQDYQALAGKIEAQLATIMAKCKLPPEVDAQVHLVLADLFAGTALMKKGENRIGGAVKVIEALASYAKYFEHPGWQPIEH